MSDRTVTPEKSAQAPPRAEERARQSAPRMPENVDSLSPETFLLLHELQVHKIELEMQNEELRRAQSELEASQARYFDLYDLAPVGYFTLSDRGVVLSANLTAAALLGVARGALVGQPLSRFVFDADQAGYFRHKRRLLETGESQVSDLRLLKGDGTPLWVRLAASTGADADGALVCRTVVSDISERKRAEAALTASEALHRMMFEQSRDALMTLAPPDWQFTTGNASAVAMFGARDQADFISRPASRYSPERQPDGSASAEKVAVMIALAMSQGSHACEWTYRRLSGEEFPANVLWTRMDVDGRPLLQATVRDDTEVKRLQARLGQSERLASMGMLAAGIAHEINNPLAYVLHNVETLAHDLPKIRERDPLLQPILDDLVECAREALDGTCRIKGISGTLGAFARVESVERCAVDLNRAIDCAVTMALNQIKYRAKLVRGFSRIPIVWASEGKLSQVFLNLLINASHAIDEGDSENNQITIRTWAEGDSVLAEVADSGRGIAPENLARVFEPFFTTKPAGAGSGLGLSICKKILGEFGGDIRVESELGKGTRFILRLPADRDAPPISVEGANSEPPPLVTLAGRILVVDDEPAIRRTLTRQLGREHVVVTVASGQEAQAILTSDQAFDVILCDIMMPGMSGIALLEWLEQQKPVLARRVVFISAGAFTPSATGHLVPVGNLKLDKPFSIDTLKRLIAKRIAALRSEP